MQVRRDRSDLRRDESGLNTRLLKRVLNCRMHKGVNAEGRSELQEIVRGDDQRVGEICSVEDNPSAGAASHNIAFTLILGDVRITAKISKRQSRVIPSIESQTGSRSALPQHFIQRHVQRRRMWHV